MKNRIIGTLAHVDAGKTTLSESMLYICGSIRKIGRVDHKDTFLDYDAQERNRGITIYSKQAMMSYKDTQITLMDTPGHVDFSSEMERTLQILDYAVMVISALDGIQVHSETIWNLLNHYQIPTFIFINKMDIAHIDKDQLMKELETKLSTSCIDFTAQNQDWLEKISLCDDALLDEFLKREDVDVAHIQEHISKRHIFPCFFGSALKMDGVMDLLEGFHTYTTVQPYPTEFGANVYKITRDEQGNKLTHMKITGGSLKVKTKLREDEKVDQIRLYSGHKYQIVNEVVAGQVCAVKGLKHVFAGEGFGIQNDASAAMLTSYLHYKVALPKSCDIQRMYAHFQQLAEEDPQLCVHYQENNQEISVQLMGEIQIEVLKHKVKERTQVDVDFVQGSVVYKETIAKAVEGIGHFEPLRHYAEVHLLLEPRERNQGLLFETNCLEDELARQWQRLIMAHLQERDHVGVLTGSSITDMRITLVGGKAHLKHTEGGDFRQATYRALRHGLKSTTSILLEPFYSFRLEVPHAFVSRAMHDLQMRNASYEIVKESDVTTQLQGRVPVSKMQNYALELHAYTKGKGRLFCSLDGYEECVDAQDVIEKMKYDSERDVVNPTGSIFCAHGSGFYVPWDEVTQHMHVKACWKPECIQPEEKKVVRKYHIEDEEVERIMRRTYGEPKERKKAKRVDLTSQPFEMKKSKESCLIVDGYNIIHDWDHLKELAKDNLDGARTQLIHYMSSFQGYKKCVLILVFDAYKVPESTKKENYNGSIYVVYTKTAQTADSYIEKTTHELAEKYNITVATSDALLQLVASAQGAQRISARELQKEWEYCNTSYRKEFESRQSKVGNRALEDLRKMNEE